jgi:transposase
VYERVAAIDVGKKEIAVTVRVPGPGPGARTAQTRKFRTFYQVLRQMVGWLVEQGVTHVAMEATGVYWKPVFHALCETGTGEAGAIEVVLVNARHVKNVPGRKTDVKDSEWLAGLLECGLLRGSFIPPRQIAAVRELTRYRKKTIQARTRELQRLAKVCEDAGIKIDSVASSITTLSARDMIEALIAGERDPQVLANLARGTMRAKIPDLTMACSGRFADHHATLARLHLDHIDHLTSMIDGLDQRIEQTMGTFAEQLALLRTIPGIGARAAQILISEIGVDMSRFPTAAHLASWAGLCPGNNESAGRHNVRPHPQGQQRGPRRPDRVRLVGRQDQHLHRRPVPPPAPPVRQDRRRQSRHRRRPHPHRDRLARAARPDPLPRTRPRLLHPTRPPRRHQTPPDPPPGSPRLPRRTHHHRLTPTTPTPAPPGSCRLPTHL